MIIYEALSYSADPLVPDVSSGSLRSVLGCSGPDLCSLSSETVLFDSLCVGVELLVHCYSCVLLYV